VGVRTSDAESPEDREGALRLGAWQTSSLLGT
jgi:hypothetical protein